MKEKEQNTVMEALKKIIRVGVIHSYDPDTRMARVKFESLGGIISAPIKVLARPRYVVQKKTDRSGDKVAVKTLQYDKNDSLVTEDHYHDAYVTDWDPKVNTMVLCIYMPDGGGDGYVLGEV